MLLRKGVYPYEYMDNWERFDETSLPKKESFYSNLNMENIDDIDYRLLIINFRNTCIKVYELDPAHFLSLPGLTWQVCLKKNKHKIRIIN